MNPSDSRLPSVHVGHMVTKKGPLGHDKCPIGPCCADWGNPILSGVAAIGARSLPDEVGFSPHRESEAGIEKGAGIDAFVPPLHQRQG